MNLTRKGWLLAVAATMFIFATCIPVKAQEFAIFATPAVLNVQNGLFTEKVFVTNLTLISFPVVRLYVDNMQTGVRVFNASGTNNGRVYVQFNQGIAPHQSADLLVEFYSPSRFAPTNTLEAVGILAPAISAVTSIANNQFTLKLTGSIGRSYIIQTTTNLSAPTWISIATNAASFTFTENASAPSRFYRAIVAP